MDETNQWDLLVSHLDDDRRHVFRMLELLEALVPASYRVQLDGWEFRPGERMQPPLDDQLLLVRHVILLVSPRALLRGFDVLPRSIQDARWRAESPAILLVVTPISAPEDLPKVLRGYDAFDLRDGPQLKAEVTRLAEMLTRRRGEDEDSDLAEDALQSLSADGSGRAPVLSSREGEPKDLSAERMPPTDSASAPGARTETASSSLGIVPPPRASDDEERVAELHSEGLYAYRRGRLEAARELFERAWTAGSAALGGTHLRTATALNFLAMTELELGDISSAHARLMEAIGPLELALGPTHRTVVDMRANLAGCFQLMGDLQEARRWQEAAVAGAVQLYGIDHPGIASHLYRLGTIAAAQQDFQLAWTSHARALTLREQNLGSEHLDTADAHDALGAIAFAKGQLELAREHLEQAFHVRGRLLGTTAPRTLQTRERLARVARAQGDLSTALHLLQGLVEALETSLGEHHPTLADPIDALAAVNFKLGNGELAYRLVDRARNLKEIAFGPEDPLIAEALYHQARVARELNNLGAARRHLERAVEILERHGSKDSPDLAAVLNDLGLTCLELGELEKVREPLERAIKIWERAPATRGHMATALYNLAALAASEGDRRRAAQLQAQARQAEEEAERMQ